VRSTARIAKEINRAWLLHDPSRSKIPPEIWRRLRAFKRQLAGPAAAIERSLKNPTTSEAIASCTRKRPVKSPQAFTGAVPRRCD
jgi:hypothetical protein